jgi:hypothetical protein
MSALTMIGILTVSLLAGGTDAITTSVSAAIAQVSTLGEPFLVETGKITSQKEIGPNRTQFTISANGTLNGNVEVTNTGEIMTISKGNNLAVDQGHGVIATTDSGEMASYMLIGTENFIQAGKTIFRGSIVYNTNSTGNLSILDNIVGIFKGQGDIIRGVLHPQNGNGNEYKLEAIIESRGCCSHYLYGCSY